ncbi:CHAT domain-containing protein [Sphingomonas sp.]|uniref:CHAT domain-containing protein n=1 Tax=Sphingomonas sp. TaxID=28214 RepID=UPI002DD641E0|nr:CHAT domain-containing protein [Sphingomonas sp.]
MKTATARPFGAAILAASALALASCATTTTTVGMSQPDTLTLGRNAAGEPCTATRNWNDPLVTDAFDAAYSITCRNVAASRPVGTVRLVGPNTGALARIEGALQCGASGDVMMGSGIGAASARRCYDKLLGSEVVAVTRSVGGRTMVAAAAPSLLGPLEQAMAIVGGQRGPDGDGGRATTASIDVAALAPLPSSIDQATLAASLFDPEAALSTGISLNHKGLNVQASRVLNDALSRVPANAAPAILVELQLEAALADSNIRFAEAAAEHFARADAVMAAEPAARTPFLQRKRDAYLALDLLNRRQFRTALTALDRQVSAPASAGQPLRDLATVRRINQPGTTGTDATSSIALPDTALLSQIVLDAQTNWARSAAMLALGDEPGATAALAAAERSYAPLQNERIDQGPVLWLGSRIERQKARLAARRGDWGTAIPAMDRALDDLRRSAVATAGTGNEPAIAELQLERASMVARRGGDPRAIREEYGRSVDALIAANSTGGAQPIGLEGYLDLLVAEAKNAPQGDTYERFFRAVQGTGEPAVARQLSQIQAVVTADQDIGVQVRDRAELEREITRLRYAIAEATNTGAPAAVLEAERQAAETKLLAIDAKLSADPRYRTIDDRPATLAEVRAALKPGEGFLKISEVNQRLYAMFITAADSFIYPVAATPADTRTVMKLADDVRGSIDGQLAQGKLVPFEEAKAFVLFRLISGPAQEAMLKSTALVVDPAGPLQKLPVGVLVTAYDPQAQRADPFDFSKTQFLAARTALSTAVSPRSFLVVRALAPSQAKQPFLGLGEHRAPAVNAPASEMVNVGFGCSVELRTLQALSARMAPISKRELEIASTALGVPGAPMVTDGAFNDTALTTRDDLSDYEVLHFATHGLEEGVWGCTKSPPALVTSFGDANSDGLLSFSEIAGLRLDANLVVLSACDTAAGVRNQALARASGQEESGSTLEGLVRAFLTANARAVMATYWQVSAEKETEDLIRTFYERARGADIGTSLQAAQRELMAQPAYSHPFYWGPYFVVGDAAKPMLSPRVAAAPARAEAVAGQ